MKTLTTALAAAGLLWLGTGAYAGEQSGAQPSGASSQQGQDSGAQGGADAADRTTQGNEPGAGVRRGSNEGGTGRDTTTGQPTATPGTGSTDEANRGAGVGEAGSAPQMPEGATADRPSGSDVEQGQGPSGSSADR